MWQNVTKINISIYHSMENDESNLNMSADLKLVKKLKSYTENKISRFLHFSAFYSFRFFGFFGQNLFTGQKIAVHWDCSPNAGLSNGIMKMGKLAQTRVAN